MPPHIIAIQEITQENASPNESPGNTFSYSIAHTVGCIAVSMYINTAYSFIYLILLLERIVPF